MMQSAIARSVPGAPSSRACQSRRTPATVRRNNSTTEARRNAMPQRGIATRRAHLAALRRTDSMAERRAMYDRAAQVFTLPADTAVEPVAAGGRPAEWIRVAGTRPDAALLYLHGGGYVIGSPRSHRHLAEALG